MTANSTPSTFVAQVDLKLAEKLQQDLKAQGFELSAPQYTVFAAKKKGVSCTLYQSGKLTVQGKEMQAFIEFYLEPEILKTFTYTYVNLDQDHEPFISHIGIDESGKGDFFGPLCIAGVFSADPKKLQAIGVRDSKTMTEVAILRTAKLIKAEFPHQIVKINPKKYNELYGQFKNLNRLLAWGHATAIEELVLRTNCRDITIDQFADEHVVLTALKRKKLDVHLTQRHRGEEDPIVAAASILAREAFVEGLRHLGDQFGMILPKGASKQTILAAKELYRKYGKDGLEQTAKLHFKTAQAVMGP